MAILKLSKADEEREIEFELAFLARLTVRQRFQMMFTKSQEMTELLRRREHRKAAQIIKRT